jgi:Flp pilus assembly protein TadD
VAAVLALGAFPAAAAQPAITPEVVMGGELLGATPGARPSIAGEEMLRLSPEMRQFLRQHVNTGAADKFKMQQLLDALMGSNEFELEYDETTRTAAETFRLRRGNCMSFTALFVSLARGAGLIAKFQEVDIPPDWSTGDTLFVLNLHINVKLELGYSGTRAVDFNIGDFKSHYDVEVIPDRRAIAHFFNNMGVERMQTGDVVDAVVFFRQAILESDGDFSPAWTNLGLLYRQAGHFEHAEAAYLQAIKVDQRDNVAMSNLVSLYERQGDSENAEVYRRKVDQHRMRNPHLRYQLARTAYAEGDIDTAIEHIKYAIRKAKDEPDYAFLLGLCHLAKGDEDKARSWVTRAERLCEDDEQRRRYSEEFEALLREP